MLRDRGHTRRQAARQSHEDIFDRRGAIVGGREKLRMIGIELKLFLMALLFAETEITFDGRMAVGTVLPYTRCPPLELRRFGCVGKDFPGAEKSFYVYAVLDCFSESLISFLPVMFSILGFAKHNASK